ncbi:UNKNOWN [Stylonychia lemnae]|uniref:Uncharacterized protein n=1 Tax=Stylonychia lemnae TaxID=5949 RepID=A0A078A3N2_STYLE|nr:UNKNOWN [Stylonychia lemnae]|eukprot:CDW76138.1 UNKNOWN [Stylonychia lemnae]
MSKLHKCKFVDEHQTMFKQFIKELIPFATCEDFSVVQSKKLLLSRGTLLSIERGVVKVCHVFSTALQKYEESKHQRSRIHLLRGKQQDSMCSVRQVSQVITSTTD